VGATAAAPDEPASEPTRDHASLVIRLRAPRTAGGRQQARRSARQLGMAIPDPPAAQFGSSLLHRGGRAAADGLRGQAIKITASQVVDPVVVTPKQSRDHRADRLGPIRKRLAGQHGRELHHAHAVLGAAMGTARELHGLVRCKRHGPPFRRAAITQNATAAGAPVSAVTRRSRRRRDSSRTVPEQPGKALPAGDLTPVPQAEPRIDTAPAHTSSHGRGRGSAVDRRAPDGGPHRREVLDVDVLEALARQPPRDGGTLDLADVRRTARTVGTDRHDEPRPTGRRLTGRRLTGSARHAPRRLRRGPRARRRSRLRRSVSSSLCCPSASAARGRLFAA